MSNEPFYPRKSVMHWKTNLWCSMDNVPTFLNITGKASWLVYRVFFFGSSVFHKMLSLKYLRFGKQIYQELC